jgi:hypothetical protein
MLQDRLTQGNRTRTNIFEPIVQQVFDFVHQSASRRQWAPLKPDCTKRRSYGCPLTMRMAMMMIAATDISPIAMTRYSLSFGRVGRTTILAKPMQPETSMSHNGNGTAAPNAVSTIATSQPTAKNAAPHQAGRNLRAVADTMRPILHSLATPLFWTRPRPTGQRDPTGQTAVGRFAGAGMTFVVGAGVAAY